METNKKGGQRTRVGKVISDNSAKTVKIEVEGIVQHSRYKKFIKRHVSFLVHDPLEQCKPGDIIRVEECRPISKSKKWVVKEIIKHADAKAIDDLKEASDD